MYEKEVEEFVEFQGESFTKSIGKRNESIWEPTEVPTYEMVDSEGLVVSSGAMILSADSLSITFIVPKTDTATIEGNHKVLVHIGDSNNAEIDDVVAVYNVKYKVKKA